MLFKIGDTIYDPNEIPCAVIFDDFREKDKIAGIIKDIKPHEIRINEGEPTEAANIEGHYWFCMNPKGFFTPETFDEWAVVNKEIKK